MKREFADALFGLARSMQLLSWWRAPADKDQQIAGQQVEQLRSLLSGMDTVLSTAGDRQAKAIATLNQDLPVLVLQAAKAGDPQSLLEAELQIAARWRQCATEICAAWSEANDWRKTASPNASSHPDRPPQRPSKTSVVAERHAP